MLFKMLKKDVAVLFSEKKTLMIFILMPIILTTILSFSLKGVFQETGKINAIKIGIVKEYDKDEELTYFMTKVSNFVDMDTIMSTTDGRHLEIDFEKVFFQDFLENEAVKSIITSEIMTDAEAQEALSNDEVAAVFYLPKNFIYDQLINFMMPFRNKISVKMVSSPNAQYSSQIAEFVMRSYFDIMNEKIIQKNVFIDVGSAYFDTQDLFTHLREVLDDDIERSESMPAIHLETINGSRAVDSFTYYSIAMMSMFILYSSGYVGRSLLREKRMQTLDRGIVAGITKVKVLTSKFLMTVILVMVQMTLLLLYAKLILKVDWNNPLMMIMGIFFSALAVSGVGIFISAITLTQDSFKVASIFENVLIHIFALFGGSYIPLEVLPRAVVSLKFIALNGVVIDLFLNIYKGVELSMLTASMLKLTGISIVFSVMAIWIVTKKEAQNYA